MTIEIAINDALRLAEKLRLPVKKTRRRNELSINVPDGLGTKDNLGTYKPWFNGMKHFYTVKPLPPKPKK